MGAPKHRKATLADAQAWTKRNLRSVATHEAGHAAMALILGSKLYYATIRPRSYRGRLEAGHVKAYPYSPSADILGSVAGAVAESVRFKRAAALCGEDLKIAAEHVTPEGLRLFCRSASGLLRMHWPGVVALATALETHGRLSGNEAKMAFMRGLCPPRPRARHASRKACK